MGEAQVDANLKLVGFDAAADFDAIVSADLFERLKPAPDIFLAAAREVGVKPSACVVVEDAAAGVQAARAAGEAKSTRVDLLKAQYVEWGEAYLSNAPSHPAGNASFIHTQFS